MSRLLLVLWVISIGAIAAETQRIRLPEPMLDSEISLEATLHERRSVRNFTTAPLSLEDVAQLLWAAQGVTTRTGERTVPSAGALYPLDVYLAAGDLDGVQPGVYRYRPRSHELQLHVSGDVRRELARSALRQQAVANGAAVVIIAGDYGRTSARYGSRATRYVHMEVGHAAQNVYLQAQSLGLGTVIIGAFEDDAVSEVLELPNNEAPLALMPLGRRR